MIKQVHENISVSINGKVFKLCFDDENKMISACERCALKGSVCDGSRDLSLLALCATIVEEPETFFIESSDIIQVHGILNQEIVISALSALRDAEEKRGNDARAKIAGKLINLI